MLYLTGVECGGVYALQGTAKRRGLIDSVNMRAQKREGRGARIGELPSVFGKGYKVGMVASGRQDIRAVLCWDTVGSHHNTGGAVVEKPAAYW